MATEEWGGEPQDSPSSERLQGLRIPGGKTQIRWTETSKASVSLFQGRTRGQKRKLRSGESRSGLGEDGVGRTGEAGPYWSLRPL